MLSRLICRLFGHPDAVFDGTDWKCTRCGLGFYEGLVKVLRKG